MTTEPPPPPQPGRPTPTPQPSPPQQVVIVKSESNGLATAGFVVALIALIFSFFPIIGLFSIPFTLLAAGLCLPALGKQTGRGLAIAGLILAGIAFLVWLLWILAIATA